ncbi:MAG: PhoH-like protein [Pseudomonadales bacterium]|nr:PhoH-like protein [Pseudomonadales bacterium]
MLEPGDTRRLARLCGQFDQHLHLIEERLGVRIRNRGNHFVIEGPADARAAARAVLIHLYDETARHLELGPEQVHLRLREAGIDELRADAAATADADANADADVASLGVLQVRRALIRPRGRSQQHYVRSIQQHDINFGIGPAGTGKTYLAVACAVAALESEQVRRILLVRPAVEAGEKLGFLPGDLAQKIDPYLRPLYDALYEMMGFDHVNKLIERHVIEVCPLAYMRGRTLNHAFVILDEGQNTTPEQMKMFLTRIGFGSKAVITGDITQVDLPRGTQSGLAQVVKFLDGIEGIGFTWFSPRDVVRHPLVQRIVEAYESFERGQARAPATPKRGPNPL